MFLPLSPLIVMPVMMIMPVMTVMAIPVQASDPAIALARAVFMSFVVFACIGRHAVQCCRTARQERDSKLGKLSSFHRLLLLVLKFFQHIKKTGVWCGFAGFGHQLDSTLQTLCPERLLLQIKAMLTGKIAIDPECNFHCENAGLL